MKIFPDPCPRDPVRLAVRVPSRKKRWCLEIPNVVVHSSTWVLVYQVGTKHTARSFGMMGLHKQSIGGPDRFLPSAIMLDPAGQRVKLPDGPSVQLRRASEHCLGNREILEGTS